MKEKDKKTARDQSKASSPASINPRAAENLRRFPKRLPPLADLIAGIRAGNHVILSQAITVVESESPRHQALARELVEACLPYSGSALRIGITGSPGVGKSTFIEALGQHIHELDQQIAVLAIDPSSHLSRGSILGDKTRMETLSNYPGAFIRPSPAGSSLGGVARKTRETILLCEAAGFQNILVETVGVGQSEMAVHSMVDCFLLLLLPGAGDELQGIKRGIVEMADLVIVNKADGNRATLAKEARQQYRNALHLLPPKESGWTPQVMTCSALEKQGIDVIWERIQDFYRSLSDNGYLAEQRRQQARYWLEESINDQLRQHFLKTPGVAEELARREAAVLEGRESPFRAAQALLKLLG